MLLRLPDDDRMRRHCLVLAALIFCAGLAGLCVLTLASAGLPVLPRRMLPLETLMAMIPPSLLTIGGLSAMAHLHGARPFRRTHDRERDRDRHCASRADTLLDQVAEHLRALEPDVDGLDAALDRLERRGPSRRAHEAHRLRTLRAAEVRPIVTLLRDLELQLSLHRAQLSPELLTELVTLRDQVELELEVEACLRRDLGHDAEALRDALARVEARR